jgi:hypothetical protein
VRHEPAQELLSLPVYLKTYPLRVVMAEPLGLSQPQANHRLRRLLPVLRDALDDPGVPPGREGHAFAEARPSPRVVIGGTERRRRRPRSPEKQAAHHSGRKRTHCGKDVAVAGVGSKRVGYPGGTRAGRAADKGIADREGVTYPPGTVL